MRDLRDLRPAFAADREKAIARQMQTVLLEERDEFLRLLRGIYVATVARTGVAFEQTLGRRKQDALFPCGAVEEGVDLGRFRQTIRRSGERGSGVGGVPPVCRGHLNT